MWNIPIGVSVTNICMSIFHSHTTRVFVIEKAYIYIHTFTYDRYTNGYVSHKEYLCYSCAYPQLEEPRKGTCYVWMNILMYTEIGTPKETIKLDEVKGI